MTMAAILWEHRLTMTKALITCISIRVRAPIPMNWSGLRILDGELAWMQHSFIFINAHQLSNRSLIQRAVPHQNQPPHANQCAELDDDAEHGKSYQLSCGEDDSAVSAQHSTSNTNGLFLIVGSIVSVILCVIMTLKIRKKSADKKENEEEIEMVQVNVRQRTIEVSESDSVFTEMEQIEGAKNVMTEM